MINNIPLPKLKPGDLARVLQSPHTAIAPPFDGLLVRIIRVKVGVDTSHYIYQWNGPPGTLYVCRPEDSGEHETRILHELELVKLCTKLK